MNKQINFSIRKHSTEFNRYFKNLLENQLSKNELSKAVLYGTLSGGKRIRPYLIHIFGEILNIPKKKYQRIGAAAECIHSYSLIHDDLPSMDNDDFRRGKLSVHKKFTEAQAILAGDSLHDIAFELISDKKTHSDPNIRIKIIHELAIALGSKGLVGGQSLDIHFENKKINITKILQIYQMKTSALFCFCCSASFIIAKRKPSEIIFAKQYGTLFGLIFQIIDDYFDEFGEFKKIGKTPGKDRKQGKNTFVKYFNKEDIIPYCEDLVFNFVKKKKKYFNEWRILEKLITNLIYRKS